MWKLKVKRTFARISTWDILNSTFVKKNNEIFYRQRTTKPKCFLDGTIINLPIYWRNITIWCNITVVFRAEIGDFFWSVSVVSAIMCRPAPLGLEDALANVAVNRGVRRVLVLGCDVSQKSVLCRKRNTALVAIRRRRMNAPDRHRLQRL